ncbi:MAG: hypothetical protein AMXMBFR13_22130 [Phycisphaerae bacterium]
MAPDGGQPPGRLFVQENPDAAEVLERVRKLEEQSRWGEAAQRYNRLLGEEPNGLVRTGEGRFQSVTDAVAARLAAWPPAAQKRFAEVLADQAARELGDSPESARQEVLQAVANRYWWTPSGARAAALFARSQLRINRPELAASWYGRLLQEHRDLSDEAEVKEAAAAAATQAVNAFQTAKAWPLPGGNAARSGGVPRPKAREWLWELELDQAGRLLGLPERPETRCAPRQQPTADSILAYTSESGGVVADEERAYTQHAGCVWAFNLSSGRLLWCYPARESKPPEPPVPQRPLSSGATPALTGQRVVANMRFEPSTAGVGPPRAHSELVALDPVYGTADWSAPPWGEGFAPSLLSVESFEGSPLVYENAVYALIRRQREWGLEEYLLASHELHTGHQRWRTFLVSGHPPGRAGEPGPRGLLAGAGGMVYVLMDLGATAGVWTDTGRVAWISLEERPREPGSATRPARPLNGEGRSGRAELIVAGWPPAAASLGFPRPQVVARPAGRSEVMIHDGYTGELIQGSTPGLQMRAVRATEGRPDQWAMVAGLVVGRVGGRLVSAAVDGSAVPWLEGRISHSPQDCSAGFGLARYLFRHDAWDRGWAAFNAALVCIEAHHRKDPKRVLDLTAEGLDLMLEAADRQLAGAVGDAGREPVNRLAAFLKRAEELARFGSGRKMRVRLHFGQLYERAERFDVAAGQYQKVLDDPYLRQERFARPPEQPTVAALAERAIDRLIAAHGREVYAHVEAQAEAQWRQALEPKEDAARLREVFLRFPHSAVGGPAIIRWAEISLESFVGRHASVGLPASRPRADSQPASMGPREVGHVLEDALVRGRITTADQKMAAVALIAQAHLRAGDLLAAVNWLVRGEREFPSASIRFAGREQTFASARRQVTSERGVTDALAPVPDAALTGSWRMSLPDGATLLIPPGATHTRFESCEVVLIHREARIEAIGAVDGNPRWKTPPVFQVVPSCLGARGPLILLATRYQMIAVNRDNGAIEWIAGDRPAAADSPAIDPEFLPAAVLQVAGEVHVVRVAQGGCAQAIRIADGGTLWNRRLAPVPNGPADLNDAHLVYVSTDTQGSRLVVLDSATGQDVRIIGLDPRGVPHACILTPQRTALVAGSDRAGCYDPATGRELWAVELPGIRVAHLRVTAEAVYLTDGRCIWRRALSDGAVAWQSKPWPDASAIRFVWPAGDEVYVLDERGGAVLDSADGSIRHVFNELPADWSLHTAWPGEEGPVAAGFARPDTLEIVWWGRGPQPLSRRALEPAGQGPVRGLYRVDGGWVEHSGSTLRGWISRSAATEPVRDDDGGSSSSEP